MSAPSNNQYSQFPQIPMSKLIPGIIVGVIALTGAGLIVGNWVMDIMDSSYRVEGRYAKMLQVPPPPVQLPKDSYVCQPNEKNPWIGCTIR